MTLLAVKLLLTPALIGGASFVARRWGPAVGGWLIALPLTSGPVILYLGLEHGPAFAAATAEGSLGGAMAVGAFSIAYARAANWRGWPAALAIGLGAFGVAGIAVQPVFGLPFAALVGLVAVVLAVLVQLMPPGSPGSPPITLPWWDVPARMVSATALVLAITAAAPLLGPQPSGLLATFPVFASVLAVFTHEREGAGQAVNVLRGLLMGVFGTCVFFVVLRLTLESLGIAVAFGIAILAALVVQWFALRIVRGSRA
jgi:hypothetical protein